jgi:hypothetical protein
MRIFLSYVIHYYLFGRLNTLYGHAVYQSFHSLCWRGLGRKWWALCMRVSLFELMVGTSNQKTGGRSVESSSFMSEDVFARTRGSFTRVSCGAVYGFESIATSGDFSTVTGSVHDALQFGVEVTFPNGSRELLVFQPRNILRTQPEGRREVLDELLNGGSVWIAHHSDVFSGPALFPKTWGLLVLPDEVAVDSVYSYKEGSFTDQGPSTKHEWALSSVPLLAIGALCVGASVSMVLGGVVAALCTVLVGLVSFIKFNLFTSISDSLRECFSMDIPRLWVQREEIEESEIEEIKESNESVSSDVEEMFSLLEDTWTEAVIINVDESEKRTQIDVLSCTGGSVTLSYRSVADGSERFLLNRLKNEYNVGSVRMLEGETVELSLASDGSEDDACLGGGYRVRSVSN